MYYILCIFNCRKAEESLYNYFNKEKDDQLKKISFQHIYEVRKFGVTPIEQSILTIFLTTHLIDQQTKNKVEIARVNKTDMSVIQTSISGVNSNCYQDKIGILPMNFTDFDINSNSSERENMTQINCTNPLVICTKIICTLQTTADTSTIGVVTLTIDLMLENFTGKCI